MANENDNTMTLQGLSESLLSIGQDLDIINGIVIGTDPDYGMHFAYLEIGDRGQIMVTKINTNFHAIDSEFLYIATELSKRIKSDQIKEIKKENGHLFYTEDGTKWTQLDGTVWGQITGTLTNQTDLKQALDAKANQTDFTALVTTVEGNTTNINKLLTDMATAQTDISGLQATTQSHTNEITQINVTLLTKVSSPTIKQIRQREDVPNNLEYTTDGTTWIPLLGEQNVVSWGEIQGDIQNQLDLVNLVKNFITEEELNTQLDNYALQSDLEITNTNLSNLQSTVNQHIQNSENPHNVTKDQVGLGNVDNTSDMEKPMSNPQQEYVNNSLLGYMQINDSVKTIIAGTDESFNDSSLDTNYIYFITDK